MIASATTQESPIWTPSQARKANANLTRFIAVVQSDRGAPVTDYATLYRWSVTEPENFWAAVWDFTEIRYHEPYERVIDYGVELYETVWFSGTRLNFAENLLRLHDDKIALVFRGEDGRRETISYRTLSQHVAALAIALRDHGVGPGDRVVGYLPNIPATVIAMLASSSLGAIWSSCSPDFGIDGVVDRFGQIEPKVLFSVDGYHYNGSAINLLPRLEQIVPRIPSLQRLVIVPYLSPKPASGSIAKAIPYAEFASPTTAATPDFTALPFNHPLYILYSSGTTGKPKCIVHGAGGTLLQHMKELVLHTDIKPDDTVFYYTTCGWMMWNWLVSSLAIGATVVLYDGSAMYPHASTLMDLAAEERVSVFGGSAKYFALLEKSGIKPCETHDLSSLRTVLSTGSPLAHTSFDYIYHCVKADVQLASISGGTDIVSCFALGNPLGPVYRGELQCRGLGMRVDVFDPQGRSVVGEKGELVCTAAFPSMPLGFWDDIDAKRFHATYFERFPGAWAHGDYAELTAHDGMIIHGRSDATLNIGGVRLGTAEIYRPVEALAEILECIAVEQEWQDDKRIVLFVKLRTDTELNEALVQKIKSTIRQAASPRHVPARVIQVQDIPRTRNGKLVELAVRDIIHQRPVQNLEAIANPQALDEFRDRIELQQT